MAPTAFQILSDLHLETQQSRPSTSPCSATSGKWPTTPSSPFLEKQLSRYWNVFFLLGNHEPVSGSWPAAKQRVRDFAERMERLHARSTIGRFIFLDQTRHDVNPTLTVLGCTLFSRVTQDQAAAVAGRLIDFRQILNWTVEDHLDAHLSDLRWLNAQVADMARTEPQRQIVVFTHHSPTAGDARAADPRHQGSPVASGFATDLGGEECWTSPSVVAWAFGHTHFSCDFVDERGKRVVANQRGYSMGLQSGFDAEKTFVVGKDAGSSMLLV